MRSDPALLATPARLARRSCIAMAGSCSSISLRTLVEIAKELAVVTLDEEADPEQLTVAALATDFEGDPFWLIDVKKFDELGGYGRALKVLCRSDRASE